MIEVMEFIFSVIKKFIITINSTSSPIPGISMGSLYFGMILAGLISYVLFIRILRGENNE